MKPEDNSIRFFRGKNAFLSNFYPVTVRYEGMSFSSVEAAFQAAKSWDVRLQSRLQPVLREGRQSPWPEGGVSGRGSTGSGISFPLPAGWNYPPRKSVWQSG